MKNNLIILNSHPIQYFAPLYAEIENSNYFNLEIWYCSMHGLHGEIDKQFGTSVKWDIPILDGYRFLFLKNNSLTPGLYRPYIGLINLSIISKLFKSPKSILIVHGWNQISCLLFIFFGKLFGHTVCMRSESPLKHEQSRTKVNLFLRKICLKYILFKFIKYFLYIGYQNKQFYKKYGVDEERLIFTPYSVNNTFFQNHAMKLSSEKEKIKAKYMIPIESKVILYCGKYIAKKKPMDLLNAFVKLNTIEENILIFVGDGELRNIMEEFILNHKLKNVILTGFINQSTISTFYSIADLFIMCSDFGETWGLSVNEAMNFGLPVIAYDTVGCVDDLIKNGHNGFVVKNGNIDGLRLSIEKILNDAKFQKHAGNISKEIISRYSFENIINGLKSIKC